MRNIAGCTDAQREDISWVNTKAGTGAMWHTRNKVHISRNLRLKNLERDPAHALPRWRGSHGAAPRHCWKNRNGFGARAERNCTAGKSLPTTLMNAVLQVLGNARWDVRGRCGPARLRAWRKVMVWGVWVSLHQGHGRQMEKSQELLFILSNMGIAKTKKLSPRGDTI